MNEISFDVPPGYHLSPFTAHMQLAANVQSLQYSVNGGAPSISKYIAYDTLIPPNPFIAVTQDGRGNVVYDGGFPKFYNVRAPSAEVTPFDHAIVLRGVRPEANPGNAYWFDRLSSAEVLVAAGDKLVFDIWGEGPEVKTSIDCIINGTDRLANASGLVDQNGLGINGDFVDLVSQAFKKWYHREFDLTGLVGKTLSSWALCLTGNLAGNHVAYFKEIYIKNSLGQVKTVLFDSALEYPTITEWPSQPDILNYTDISKALVDVRDHLTATQKILFNSLKFIENSDKVAAGNKKVLVIGDAILGVGSYHVKDMAGVSGFGNTFTGICNAAGYQVTLKDRGDYGGIQITATLAELEQYCCVIVMSSVHQVPAASYLISPECIDAFMTYRQNGNGIMFITDHGPDLATIGDVTSSNKGGFFATANAVAVNFGVWFSGNYNRSPVNVGFLRQTYGDHPLYNTMLDTEDFYAGGSESKVNVASFDTILPGDVPPIPIPNGRTVIQIAAVLDSGEIITYSAVYWVVSFKISFTSGTVSKDNGQVLDIGVKSKVALNAKLIGALEEAASGVVYRKGVRVGVMNYTQAGGSVVTWDSGHNGTFKFNDGDEFKVVLSTPLIMTSAITIDRFHPPLPEDKKLPELMNILNDWKPALTNISRLKTIIDEIAAQAPGLGIQYLVSLPGNLKLIREHFNNEGPTST